MIQENLTVKMKSEKEEQVVAYVDILSYKEKPAIFDFEGNPKAFSIQVKVKYKIICLSKAGEENAQSNVKTAKEGKFSLSETFLLSSFLSHMSGMKKVRLSLKEKIKNRIVLLSLKAC